MKHLAKSSSTCWDERLSSILSPPSGHDLQCPAMTAGCEHFLLLIILRDAPVLLWAGDALLHYHVSAERAGDRWSAVGEKCHEGSCCHHSPPSHPFSPLPHCLPSHNSPLSPLILTLFLLLHPLTPLVRIVRGIAGCKYLLKLKMRSFYTSECNAQLILKNEIFNFKSLVWMKCNNWLLLTKL